jgi:HAD superfamily hydrolase (TIGR01509 family)
MRMPAVSAVLFDYGRTLVTFDYPRRELTDVVDGFRPAIVRATGRPAPPAGEIMTRVLLPLEELIEDPAEDEVAYLEVFGAAWRNAGLDLPPELLYEILDAEQCVWDRAARVDDQAPPVLSWLREHGLKIAVCSNAPFPGSMMRRQLVTNGVDALVDAVVFSSDVGRRKPAPEIYHAALDALGVAPADALFVGDRVREDYTGPRAVGMRAVICTAHAAQIPDLEVPTIESLSDLREIV